MLVTILTIALVIVALALIVVVLLQHGKQQGLSGAIAGGAETFFGKNKGRTVDVMLKKFTSVIAILFIVLALSLTFVTTRQSKTTDENVETEVTDTTEASTASIQISEDKSINMNANGDYTDAEGNILTFDSEQGFLSEDGTVYATMEEFQAALEQMSADADASAEVDGADAADTAE